MHEHLTADVKQAAGEICRRWAGRPRVGIILGTGLGSVAQEIATEATIDYSDIPHFPRSRPSPTPGNWSAASCKGCR